MRAKGNWGAMAAMAVVVLVVVLGMVAFAAMRGPGPSASAGQGLVAASAPASGASTSADGSAAPAKSSAASASSATASASSASSSPSSASSAPRSAGLPDPRLTPGAVNRDVTPANLDATICAKGWTATIRPPASYTTALKRQQIKAYGYTDTRLADYEEDHLISLELGGDPRDPANLWPEPYSATLPDGTPVGARVKDQVENHLNDLVCSGAMPLATAQHLIATDWIAAWRQYVAP